MGGQLRVVVCVLAVCSIRYVEGSCDEADRATCPIMSGVCNDQELATTYCPHMCGLCARPCSEADRPTCPAMPGVCTDQELAADHCPHMCGLCSAQTAVPPVETCVDYVGNGVLCAYLPGICSDPYGQVFCRRHCGVCESSPEADAPSLTPTSAGPVTCGDRVVNGLVCASLPGICTDPFGQLVCQHYCGHCAETTSEPVETCVDNLGHGVLCQHLPGICTDPFGQLVCRRHCSFCQPNPDAAMPAVTTSATPTVCTDRLTNGLTCASLPGVCDNTYGHLLCQKHCSLCQ